VDIGSQSGNILSTSATPFAAGLNSGVGAITTVAGASSVKVASFTLNAGPAEGVNVVSVTLTTNGGVAGNFQNLKMMVGGMQFGTTQNTLSNNTSYTFSGSSPIGINAGASVVVDVYADTISGTTYGAAYVVALTGASGTGSVTNSTRTISATTSGQKVTVNGNGLLTVAVASPAVTSQYVGMGVTGVKLASFKLSADNNEALNITQVTLTDTASSSNLGSNFYNFKLMNGATQVGSTMPSLTGTTSPYTVTFTIPVSGTGSLMVPQNGYVNLDVVADANVYGSGAVSGGTDAISLATSSVQYQGAQSSVTATQPATSVASGATFTLYRTSLAVASGPSFTAPAGLSDGSTVGQFTFSAGSGYDAILKNVQLANVGSLIGSTSSVVLRVYGSDQPTVQLGTVTTTGTGYSNVQLNGTTGWTIPRGSNLYLIVEADLGSAASTLVKTSPSTRSYQILLKQGTSDTWSDSIGNVTTFDPSITMPVYGATTNFNF
jgi:hypothetical protein